MIPTTLHHLAGCTKPRAERIATTGVTAFRCPICGAIASTSRSA